MIARLTGTVAEKGADWVVLDVAGVGYFLHVSANSAAAVPSLGGNISMVTHMHVREDALQLYGFTTADEKELFGHLISVSGVGPKVALGILSHLNAEKLARAITLGDADLLASVPGIGKKTAARLILELREKLRLPEACFTGLTVGGNMEAREALVGLGYSLSEAEAALEGVSPDSPVEECIKLALRKLGARA